MRIITKFITNVLFKEKYQRSKSGKSLIAAIWANTLSPGRWGCPKENLTYDTEADHCWFELSKEGFEYTEQPANVSLTAQQLAENFAACRNNWQDAEYAALDEDSQGFGMELHGL